METKKNSTEPITLLLSVARIYALALFNGFIFLI